jgi:hypothetical protein
LLKYKELFPRLEKLTIDPKERFSGRKFTDDYCADNLWEIGQLIDILELLASIKHLQIWKLKLELMEGNFPSLGKPPVKRVSFQLTPFSIEIIILNKFLIESTSRLLKQA